MTFFKNIQYTMTLLDGDCVLLGLQIDEIIVFKYLDFTMIVNWYKHYYRDLTRKVLFVEKLKITYYTT